MSGYQEFPAPRPLAGHLACLWTRHVGEDEPAPTAHVLPDACIDVVWTAGQAPQIAGPDTGPVRSLLKPGTAIVGVRFKPGKAPAALGVPACDLRDQRVPLEAVWGTSVVQRLCEEGESAEDRDRFAALLRELERRLARNQSEDSAVDAMVRWAVAGGYRSRPATAKLGVGERQLLRRFQDRVGYGPKMLQRVLRFQHLLVLANRQPPAGLAGLAAEAGYADQPHMTRDVRRLAGTTPSMLLRRL